jgi:hypothetical protein
VNVQIRGLIYAKPHLGGGPSRPGYSKPLECRKINFNYFDLSKIPKWKIVTKKKTKTKTKTKTKSSFGCRNASNSETSSASSSGTTTTSSWTSWTLGQIRTFFKFVRKFRINPSQLYLEMVRNYLHTIIIRTIGTKVHISDLCRTIYQSITCTLYLLNLVIITHLHPAKTRKLDAEPKNLRYHILNTVAFIKIILYKKIFSVMTVFIDNKSFLLKTFHSYLIPKLLKFFPTASNNQSDGNCLCDSYPQMSLFVR